MPNLKLPDIYHELYHELYRELHAILHLDVSLESQDNLHNPYSLLIEYRFI